MLKPLRVNRLVRAGGFTGPGDWICTLPSSLLVASPPSSLLQSLAGCHAHATSRSWLTDGWMAMAKAIRQWAEWNRMGPIHYRVSRLCLIFNLYFAEGRPMQSTSTFEHDSALPCYRSAVTFHIPICSYSSLGHLSYFWEDTFFVPTTWQAPAEEMELNSKCVLWNEIVAMMLTQFCDSLR